MQIITLIKAHTTSVDHLSTGTCTSLSKGIMLEFESIKTNIMSYSFVYCLLMIKFKGLNNYR